VTQTGKFYVALLLKKLFIVYGSCKIWKNTREFFKELGLIAFKKVILVHVV
jgi:hypothetical protein